MVLDSFLSNEKNKAALVRLSGNGRLSHAVFLEGPRGSGRYTLARMIAAMAVCRADTPGCGVCPDCKMALAGSHPDVETYAKAGANGGLTIKSLRAINQSVATPPVQGRRRVVLLRDIQDAAQARTLNTLLKVIEEPPGYLMFIITADNRESLLPTILSRCQLFRMELPDPESCAMEALRLLDGAAERPQALRMAHLTGGNIGRTVALLSDTDSAKVMRDALALADALLGGDGYALLRMLSKYERNRPGFRELLACLRDIFGRVVESKYDPNAGFAELADRITAPQGVRILDILAQADREAQYNLNLPLALTQLGARLHAAAY